MPLQVVIDDVGWWSGNDGSMRQEPYRTGINRNHVPADYKAIVDLGRALDQAAGCIGSLRMGQRKYPKTLADQYMDGQ